MGQHDSVLHDGLNRTDRRKLRTRAAIIDAAARQLESKPWTEIAVSTVAEDADVAVGTVYNHFVDAGELVSETAQHLVAPIETVADASDAVGPSARLHELLVAVAALSSGDRTWCRRMRNLDRVGDRECQRLVSACNSQWDSFVVITLTALLRSTIDLGANADFESADASTVARLMKVVVESAEGRYRSTTASNVGREHDIALPA